MHFVTAMVLTGSLLVSDGVEAPTLSQDESALLEALEAFAQQPPRSDLQSVADKKISAQWGAMLSLNATQGRGLELTSENILSDRNSYGALFLRGWLQLSPRSKAWDTWLMLDTGELRRSDLSGFDTDLVTTNQEQTILLSSGRTLQQEWEATSFVRELVFRRYLDEWALSAGRQRITQNPETIMDTYLWSLLLEGKFAKSWHLKTGFGLWGDTWTAFEQRIPTELITLKWARPNIQIGCTAAALQDDTGLWGQYLLPLGSLGTSVSFERSELAQFGCNADYQVAKHQVALHLNTSRGRFTAPSLEDTALKNRGRAASLSWRWQLSPSRQLSTTFLYYSGNRQSALEQNPRTITGFIGIAPRPTYTSLFFTSGWQHAVSLSNIQTAGIDAAGVRAMVLEYLHQQPSQSLRLRLAWLRADSTTLDQRSGRYGTELNIVYRWPFEPDWSLDIDAGVIRLGPFFDRSENGSWAHQINVWVSWYLSEKSS